MSHHMFLVIANWDTTLCISTIVRELLNSSLFMNPNPRLHYHCFLLSSPSHHHLHLCSIKCQSPSTTIVVVSKPPPLCLYFPSLIVMLFFLIDQYSHLSYSCCCRHTTEMISSSWIPPQIRSCGSMFVPLFPAISVISEHVHHIAGKLCFMNFICHS
jgi:hypothetical protein